MSPITRANGVDHWYEWFSEFGEPALLISGIGGQYLEWDSRFCELLTQRGFRVLRYDLREAGESEHFPDAVVPDLARIADGDYETLAYILDDLVGDAVDLLDSLGIASAHMIGHSLGGMIAQAVAIKFSSRVRSLTSIASTTGDRSVGNPRDVELLASTTQRGTERETAIESHVARRRAQWGSGFTFDEANAYALAERLYERDYFPDGRSRRLATAVAASDRTAQLSQLTMPSLVVHGTDDPLVQFDGGEATAKALRCELFAIDGMGHHMPSEVYADVATAIAESAYRARSQSEGSQRARDHRDRS